MAILRGFGRIPFEPTPRGYLPINEDSNVIKANLLTLINTFEGERVMMPEYGSELDKKLFSPNTPNLHDDIKEIILNLIERWEPAIVVNDLTVGKPGLSQIGSDEDPDHIVYVRLEFALKTNLSLNETLEVLVPLA